MGLFGRDQAGLFTSFLGSSQEKCIFLFSFSLFCIGDVVMSPDVANRMLAPTAEEKTANREAASKSGTTF